MPTSRQPHTAAATALIADRYPNFMELTKPGSDGRAFLNAAIGLPLEATLQCFDEGIRALGPTSAEFDSPSRAWRTPLAPTRGVTSITARGFANPEKSITVSVVDGLDHFLHGAATRLEPILPWEPRSTDSIHVEFDSLFDPQLSEHILSVSPVTHKDTTNPMDIHYLAVLEQQNGTDEVIELSDTGKILGRSTYKRLNVDYITLGKDEVLNVMGESTTRLEHTPILGTLKIYDILDLDANNEPTLLTEGTDYYIYDGNGVVFKGANGASKYIAEYGYVRWTTTTGIIHAEAARRLYTDSRKGVLLTATGTEASEVMVEAKAITWDGVAEELTATWNHPELREDVDVALLVKYPDMVTLDWDSDPVAYNHLLEESATLVKSYKFTDSDGIEHRYVVLPTETFFETQGPAITLFDSAGGKIVGHHKVTINGNYLLISLLDTTTEVATATIYWHRAYTSTVTLTENPAGDLEKSGLAIIAGLARAPEAGAFEAGPLLAEVTYSITFRHLCLVPEIVDSRRKLSDKKGVLYLESVRKELELRSIQDRNLIERWKILESEEGKVPLNVQYNKDQVFVLTSSDSGTVAHVFCYDMFPTFTLAWEQELDGIANPEAFCWDEDGHLRVFYNDGQLRSRRYRVCRDYALPDYNSDEYLLRMPYSSVTSAEEDVYPIDVWNEFDEFGLLYGIKRLPSEGNYDLSTRLWRAIKQPMGSHLQGLINAAATTLRLPAYTPHNVLYYNLAYTPGATDTVELDIDEAHVLLDSVVVTTTDSFDLGDYDEVTIDLLLPAGAEASLWESLDNKLWSKKEVPVGLPGAGTTTFTGSGTFSLSATEKVRYLKGELAGNPTADAALISLLILRGPTPAYSFVDDGVGGYLPIIALDIPTKSGLHMRVRYPDIEGITREEVIELSMATTPTPTTGAVVYSLSDPDTWSDLMVTGGGDPTPFLRMIFAKLKEVFPSDWGSFVWDQYTWRDRKEGEAYTFGATHDQTVDTGITRWGGCPHNSMDIKTIQLCSGNVWWLNLSPGPYQLADGVRFAVEGTKAVYIASDDDLVETGRKVPIPGTILGRTTTPFVAWKEHPAAATPPLGKFKLGTDSLGGIADVDYLFPDDEAEDTYHRVLPPEASFENKDEMYVSSENGRPVIVFGSAFDSNGVVLEVAEGPNMLCHEVDVNPMHTLSLARGETLCIAPRGIDIKETGGIVVETYDKLFRPSYPWRAIIRVWGTNGHPLPGVTVRAEWRDTNGNIPSTEDTNYISGPDGYIYISERVAHVDSTDPGIGLRVRFSTAPDVIENGDFTDWTGDDPDRWTVGEAGITDVTESVSKCQMTDADNVEFAYISQAVLSVGETYTARLTCTLATSGELKMGDADEGDLETIDTAQDYSHTWVAGSTAFMIRTNGTAAAPDDITFDDVEVRRVDTTSIATKIVDTDWIDIVQPALFRSRGGSEYPRTTNDLYCTGVEGVLKDVADTVNLLPTQPNLTPGGGNITVVAWVKVSAGKTNKSLTLVDVKNTSDANEGLAIVTTAIGKINVNVHGDAAYANAVPIALPVDEYCRIQADIYVNGLVWDLDITVNNGAPTTHADVGYTPVCEDCKVCLGTTLRGALATRINTTGNEGILWHFGRPIRGSLYDIGSVRPGAPFGSGEAPVHTTTWLLRAPTF